MGRAVGNIVEKEKLGPVRRKGRASSTFRVHSSLDDSSMLVDTSVVERIKDTRKGALPVTAYDLQKVIGATDVELERIIGISCRTLARHKASRKRLNSVVSDRLARTVRIVDDIRDTLGGDYSDVTAWLHSPCGSMGDVKPVDVLDTDAGVEEVRDTLGRIRHGIFG